jgi:hypothetical protein
MVRERRQNQALSLTGALPSIDPEVILIQSWTMKRKMIHLDLDAYEKLKAAKREGESFSDVIRRARLPDPVPTFADLREHMRRGGSGVDPRVLDEIEAATGS